jgi:hypothetical protein
MDASCWTGERRRVVSRGRLRPLLNAPQGLGATYRFLSIVCIGLLCAVAPPGAAWSQQPAAPALTITPCPADPSHSCTMVTAASGQPTPVWLSNNTLYLVDSAIMGTFEGLANHQLAYIYANEGRAAATWVFVVDMTAAQLVAWIAAPLPYDVFSTYFSYIGGPDKNKYPFLAPGQHYLNQQQYNSFNFLCIFDPAYIAKPSPSCYTGFKPYPATFENALNLSGFRHNGGWAADVDGDGWDDIHLPFLQYILTISGKTGQQLGLSHFDVAHQSEPNAPAYFHSGRFYGGFVVRPGPTSPTQDILFAAANAVGTFGDIYCNVSRYIAVAQWGASGYELQWSNYLSFSKTIFNSPYNSVNNYARLGNDLDACAHRYSNSLEQIDGKVFVVYDSFTRDDTAIHPVCQADLLEEQRSSFTNSGPYNQCAVCLIPQIRGKWSVQFLTVSDGGGVNRNPDAYIWGRAINVVPENSDLRLIQNFTANRGVVTFGETAAAIDSFQLVKLSKIPSWDVVTELASPPAPPKTIDLAPNSYGAFPRGIGSSWGGIRELLLQDIDGDGYNDIALANGQWLGWSTSQHKLVVKNAPGR